MTNIRFYFLLIAFLLCSGNVLKAQNIITDRPDQTESSSTIPKGSFQIEAGMVLGFVGKDTLAIRTLSLPSVLFRIAVAKWIEIRVFNQVQSVKIKKDSRTITGINDLEIGTKIQLFRKENVNIEIAFLSHLVIPTGSQGLSTKKFGTINKLSIAHSLGKKVGLGYNVGYNYFGYGDGIFTYSLALGVSITDKFSLYVEPYGDWVDFKHFFANADAGITYLLKENLQLDFSFGLGINYTMNYISAGFSWNISKKPNKETKD